MAARSVNPWVSALVLGVGVFFCSCARRDAGGEPSRDAEDQRQQPAAARQPLERKSPKPQPSKRQPAPLVGSEARGTLTATGTVAAIYGWAWDPTQPDLAVAVDIYDGDTLLGSILANKYLPHLVKSGIGNGKHGFFYPFPTRLRDGKPHRLSVKIARANIELQKSPQSLTYAPPPKSPPPVVEKKTVKPEVP